MFRVSEIYENIWQTLYEETVDLKRASIWEMSLVKLNRWQKISGNKPLYQRVIFDHIGSSGA